MARGRESALAGCGLSVAAGTTWLVAAAGRRTSDPDLTHIWGVFALYGSVLILLSLATLTHSPRAWLLLQLFSMLGIMVALLAVLSLFDGRGRPTGVGLWMRVGHNERVMLVFVSVSAFSQFGSILLLNRRNARRWCRVDPEGARLSA
jgi:hypothetical protein